MTRTALKGLASRRMRTALTALAIVIGVAMVSAAYTLTDTMRGAADSLSAAAYDSTEAVVTGRTAYEVSHDSWATQKPEVDASLLARVRALPEVEAAAGDITNLETMIIGSDGKPSGDGPYFGVGLDTSVPGFQELTPFQLQTGRWATGPGEVVVDAGTAEREGFALGETIKVAVQNARPYEVVGITRFGTVDSMGTATIAVFDLDSAQEAFGMTGAYDSILVSARDGVAPAALREALSAAVGTRGEVQSAAAQDRFTLDGLKQFISIIQVVLLVFGGIAILVGAFTIFNTLSITVAQRTREFGLLRMVGASRRQVLGSVIAEAFTIGVLASLVGLFAGFGLAVGLDAVFAQIGLDLPKADMEFATRTVVVALLVGIVVTTLAGLLPAWRATRVPPVAALRAAEHAERRLRWPSRLVRAVAGLVGRPAERLGGPAGRLARRNAMRHPGRTAATASALIIGVALVTLVTVVATGLKDTTSGSLERRIDAGFVANGADGWSAIEEDVETSLARLPGVTATSIRQDGALINGDEEVVNSIDPVLAAKVMDFEWKHGDRSTLASLGRDGAVVDEGWAAEQGLTVGESFTVTSAAGKEVALTVRGIEESPVLDALGLGPVTMSDAAFDEAFSQRENFLTLVAAPESAGGQLHKALAAYPDAQVQTLEEFVESRVADVDTLLSILYVLLALAVIVSLFGIVNTLVLSTFERTRELGMLRAVGMTRRQVRRMVRHESIITALIGALAGMVAGLVLAWIVTTLFEAEGLSFAIPVGALVTFTVVAVIAGVLAAIGPARRASRLDVLGALAYE